MKRLLPALLMCGCASHPEQKAFAAKAQEWAALNPPALAARPLLQHPSGSQRLPGYIRPKLAIIDKATGKLDETHFGLPDSLRARTPAETGSVVRMSWERRVHGKSSDGSATFYQWVGQFDVIDVHSSKPLKTWPHPEAIGVDRVAGEIPPMIGKGPEITGAKPLRKIGPKLQEIVSETQWLWSQNP